MCTNQEDLKKLSNWDGKTNFSRQNLMDKLQCNCKLKLKIFFNSYILFYIYLKFISSFSTSECHAAAKAFRDIDNSSDRASN